MKIKEEEIKMKEEERKNVIQNGSNDKFNDLINDVDKQFNNIAG